MESKYKEYLNKVREGNYPGDGSSMAYLLYSALDQSAGDRYKGGEIVCRTLLEKLPDAILNFELDDDSVDVSEGV